MNQATNKNKPLSIKEVYRHSREHVSQILKILTPVKQETMQSPALEKEFEVISKLAQQVYASQKTEGENDYSQALIAVSYWVVNALNRDFVAEHSKKTPSMTYAIKKAFEVLHLLLHRDLRRRQLSSTESQLYFEFHRLASSFPAPPKDNAKKAEASFGKSSVA